MHADPEDGNQMVDKDFRFAPDPDDLAKAQDIEAARRQAQLDEAREVRPVEFLDKPVPPDQKRAEGERPVSPRYDWINPAPEEQELPKDSSALEPADTSSSSSSDPTSVPGLEDVLQADPTRTSADAEKASGPPKVPSPGTPTSSPVLPTPPGKSEPSA